MKTLLLEKNATGRGKVASKLDQTKALLDSKKARYLHFSYSSAYSFEEIQECGYASENDQIESVFVEIVDKGNTEIIRVVVPAIRRIDLASLGQSLAGVKVIGFVGKQEAEQFLSDFEIGTLPPFPSLNPKIRTFFSHKILELPNVSFFVQDYTNRIRMPLKDFLAAARPMATLELSTLAKYKTEVVRVFPEKQCLSSLNEKRCILGFSLQNQNFSPTKLVGMAEWISKNFSECNIFVGDSIHRITLEIQGFESGPALNRGLKMGRDIIDRNAFIFEQHQGQCRFNFILCSELQKDKDYPGYYAALKQLYEKNEQFHAAVKLFAEAFISRLPTARPEHFDHHVNLSCTYLLEEAACLAILIKQGWLVFVYPGALTVLQELGQGLYPDAPGELKKLISVSLNLKRR